MLSQIIQAWSWFIGFFLKSLKLCLSLLTFSLILTFCIFSFVLVYCSYSCVCGIPPISSRYIPCSPYIVRYSLFRYFLCYFDSHVSFCQIYLPECCYQMQFSCVQFPSCFHSATLKLFWFFGMSYCYLTLLFCSLSDYSNGFNKGSHLIPVFLRICIWGPTIITCKPVFPNV